MIELSNQSPHIRQSFQPNTSSVRKQIEDNFNKGLIDQDTFNKANEQLDNLLSKGGVGSGRKPGNIKYKELEFVKKQAEEWQKKLDNAKTLHEKMVASANLKAYESEVKRVEKSVKKSETDLDLIKAKGEGSRGGHVIGHTKSGKPVYSRQIGQGYHSFDREREQSSVEKETKAHKGFSEQDHRDASDVHKQEAEQHRRKTLSMNSRDAEKHHKMVNYHEHAAANHDREANLQYHGDQKKKQLQDHAWSHKFHSDMASNIKSQYGQWLDHDSPYGKDIKEQHDDHMKRAEHHQEQINRLEKEGSSSEGKLHGSSFSDRGPSQENWRNTSGVPSRRN